MDPRRLKFACGDLSADQRTKTLTLNNSIIVKQDARMRDRVNERTIESFVLDRVGFRTLAQKAESCLTSSRQRKQRLNLSLVQQINQRRGDPSVSLCLCHLPDGNPQLLSPPITMLASQRAFLVPCSLALVALASCRRTTHQILNEVSPRL